MNFSCSICDKLADFYCDETKPTLFLCADHQRPCCKLIIYPSDDLLRDQKSLEEIRNHTKKAAQFYLNFLGGSKND